MILDVSLKVLPQPAARRTLRFDGDEATAILRLNEWAGRPLPINASAWWHGALVLRLAGAGAAVDAAAALLGGEPIDDTLADGFWRGLRDHRDDFFNTAVRRCTTRHARCGAFPCRRPRRRSASTANS